MPNRRQKSGSIERINGGEMTLLYKTESPEMFTSLIVMERTSDNQLAANRDKELHAFQVIKYIE